MNPESEYRINVTFSDGSEPINSDPLDFTRAAIGVAAAMRTEGVDRIELLENGEPTRTYQADGVGGFDATGTDGYHILFNADHTVTDLSEPQPEPAEEA